MLGGGIADKWGNEYEARWTLLEILRVLRGFADVIRPEPFNEAAGGFEFRVNAGDIEEWHQCKRQRTDGSWTVHALAAAGILQAFANKLTSPTTVCVFVSSDPAPAFEKLIEKAGLAETPSDFFGTGGIGKADEQALKELGSVWTVSPDVQFSWLKRCRVEVVSEGSLLRRLNETCSVIFKTPAKDAINALARFVGENLGKRLTTERLRSAVNELEIDWAVHLDPSMDAKFRAATDEYLATLSTTIAGLQLSTSDLESAINAAFNAAPATTIIAGGAGSGKSVALSRVVACARSREWPVLAFRIDRYLDVRTLSELGDAIFETASNPVSAFGSRYINQPSLIIIDQVDAVSESSGRSGQIRELLFRMISQAAYFPKLRVVAACRSYDLDGDTRLAALSKAQRVTTIRLKPMNWQEGVEPVLDKLGVDARRFKEKDRALISSPINLRLLAEIVEAGEPIGSEISSSRLFDGLIRVRAREIQQSGFAWTPEQALGAIAQNMSDNQALTAPASVLDVFPGAVSALSSRNLITSIRGTLQFAHESFFDHSFSRRFVSSGESVSALLLGSEQRLFRRTQVRQIFSRLRDEAQDRYIRNLRGVMDDDAVRYLVKDAIAYWLSEIDSATNQELSLVLTWFQPGHNLEKLSRVILNGRGWLQILYDSRTLHRWIGAGGDKKDLAFWLINRGAVTHSELSSEIVRGWWEQDREGRAAEAIKWLESLYPDGPIGSLETLYADTLDNLPSEHVKDDLFANFGLGSWVHKSKELGARVLGLWIEKWLSTFPDTHPFSDHSNQSESHWLMELAKDEPKSLLKAGIPGLALSLQREQAALAAGTLAHPVLSPPHYEHDQDFVRAIVLAMRSVAATEPQLVSKYVEALGDDNDVGLFVRLQAISANGQGLAHLLLPTLARDRAFKVGDGDADWLPFARAAAAAAPHMALEDWQRVEKAIISYRPEYRWAVKYRELADAGELYWPNDDVKGYIIRQLNLSGQDERAIFSTIGRENLSSTASKRLDELDRKFHGQPLPQSHSIRGGFVRSPISLEKAEFMSDAQWITAIDKYADERRHLYVNDGVIGGARELSSTMQARAKVEPERFVSLLEKLPVSVNSQYAEAVLMGLRESEAPIEVVVRAFKSAIRWPIDELQRALSWVVQSHPAAGADPEVLRTLIERAARGSASDTAVRTANRSTRERKSVSDLLNPNDDLASSGINGERGAAYEALAGVLWNEPSTLPEILDLLGKQAEAEPLVSVRLCMAHTINSVGKYDTERAISLLQALASKNLRVLQSHAAQHMLRWVIHEQPGVVSNFAESLIRDDSISSKAFGHFLESHLALLDEAKSVEFVAGFENHPLRRQIAAYRASGNLQSDLLGDRAEKWLAPLFNDEDADVRRDAIHINWSELLDGDTDRTDLAITYIKSLAFNDNSDTIMRALEDRVSQFPELTYMAVKRVLALYNSWANNDRNGHHMTLHHMTKLLVELYRSGSSDAAKEALTLDLFDEYLSQESFGLRSELQAYERH